MKAYVLYGAGQLRFEDVTKPKAGEKTVLVKVAAAGICGSDIPRIYRTGAHIHPLIPGHEFSGTVVETGEAAINGVAANEITTSEIVTNKIVTNEMLTRQVAAGEGATSAIETKDWLGKRVGVFPLIPCGKCLPCQNRQFEMCRHYSYLGSRCDGGFAEYVVAPEKNLIALPSHVSFEEAAMLEPMAVAVHALRHFSLLTPDSDRQAPVVVYGLGTIGLLIVMFLKEAGYEQILTVGNKEFQRKIIEELKIPTDNFCDSTAQDVAQWVAGKTGGAGGAVIFECIGKTETIENTVAMTAAGGKVVLVGNPASDISFSKEVYWKILRNQIMISGTWNSSFTGEKSDDWHYVIDRLENKKIEPAKLITHRFSLEQLEEGMKIMRDKKEDYIKVMGILD